MKKKDTYYFSHDSNARNDEKILAIRMRYKVEGYGIYFMILERLRECAGTMSVKDYNVLAFDFRVSADLVKSVVEDFGLFVFTEDGKYFYSERMQRNMKIVNEKSEKARINGKKGGAPKGNKNASKRSKKENVKPILTEYEKKEEKIIEEDRNDFKTKHYELTELKDLYISDKDLIKSVINNPKNLMKNEQQLVSQLEEFIKMLSQNGEKSKTRQDFNSHFRYWHIKRTSGKHETIKTTSTIPVR